MATLEPLPSSFRDPSGQVFISNGEVFRRVNEVYKEHYDKLMSSGLYDDLVESGLLIPHEEVQVNEPWAEGAYKILKPQQIPFISYPYEWSFTQLKDAALATLEIQEKAMEHGMILKDCSAYNIQFPSSRPVFIDTLSFETYIEGNPWVAYQQFCRHFLAPLAVMSKNDISLNQLLRIHIDGIPLNVASAILPGSTRFSLPLLLHIHLHSKSVKQHENASIVKSNVVGKVSRVSLLGLISNLRSGVSQLTWKPSGTEWVDYYSDDSYDEVGLADKQRLVEEYLDQSQPKTVIDLGSNTGMYSRIAAKKGAYTVSMDIDPACVELNYKECKEEPELPVLPMLIDLSNPSPGIGWANEERMAIKDRMHGDTTMGLALIHHLAIGCNIPLVKVADFMAGTCKSLIIEFVPKSDKKTQKLLAAREDIFADYTTEGFEKAFSIYFEITRKEQIKNSERTLYLMKVRNS